jgi:hypothetical protein
MKPCRCQSAPLLVLDTAIRRHGGGAIWRGKHLIALSSASEHAPQVTLTTPLAGTTLSGPTTVTWDAWDADGDALSYAVELSPGGGASWLPVAVGLREPTVTLDPLTLPGTHQALLRVEASDGFDSTAAVTDATFRIPAGAPQVSISAPVADQTVAAGTSVSFEASAIDMTHGALPDTAYQWSSDVDGDLGVGPWLVTSDLPVGQHTVSVTVTDRAGLSSTARVRVVVTNTPAPCAPVELPSVDAPGAWPPPVPSRSSPGPSVLPTRCPA